MTMTQLPAAKAWQYSGALTLLFVVWSIICISILQVLLPNKEIANDVTEYEIYLKDSTILLRKIEDPKIYGGRVAAPLMPLCLVVPVKVFLGLNLSQTVSLRLTMILWESLGLLLTWRVAFAIWGAPRSAKKWCVPISITLLPLTWLSGAILTQDDCIAAGLSGCVLYVWWRKGWGEAAIAAGLGMFMAKPFFLLYFASIWMSRLNFRIQLVAMLVAIIALLSLLGFFYIRQGTLQQLNHIVPPYMAASAYSMWWLWLDQPTLEINKLVLWTSHAWSLRFTLLWFIVWTGSAWFRRWQLPQAIVGIYTLMFVTMVGMMPEYEWWYFPWVMVLAWGAWQQGRWRLFSALVLHNCFGYAYKILYACDSQHFLRHAPSPLSTLYDRYVGVNLWWPLQCLCVLHLLNCVWIAYELWQYQTNEYNEPVQAE
jgi:hypothetical protein